MNLYEKIIKREEKISVVGLGYVGMPIAVSFAKKIDVIGFDINKEKVKQYINGIDATKEVGDDEIRKSTVDFTYDENKLRECKFHIVAVPTPINNDKTPNLKPVIGSSEIVGRNLSKGSIVVYESTVYPGVTEEVCIPVLERESGLKCGQDFFVGYSPERINPGDKVHRLETIVKIVSGMNEETLETIAKVYELIIEAGVHRAESIRVAEAAKVIENSQRDINIAFMNELSIIFNKMGIDTKSVLEAAGTKWNFLNFMPGLVGGHCIGVDPYYLTYKAEEMGYHSQIILSGRRINDDMGKYVAESTVKNLIKANKQIKGARVGILGFTFKENCPDTRNSKVIDIVKELEEYGVETIITDPIANIEEVKEEYGLELHNIQEVNSLDGIILAVPHREYKSINTDYLDKLFKCNSILEDNSEKVIVDVKGILNRKDIEEKGYLYWRL
ncbi:nucleotide sugar dehydrogenase [Clostridium perfringens]|nr:nucleotide sugar dehydrogenase [Clostridium perfringens]MDM0769767.1 nucleotide sugar dehydrogenase [Clostridium perfringens]